LTQSLSSIRSAERETARAVAMKSAFDTSVSIVRTERHRFSQQLLNEVVEETNRLYERIHPNEGLAISRMELDPNRRASLNQQARFGTYDNVPPQAYFSEAHLDTLGFCFWLAVAKRDSAQQPLTIVIDDVFSSADSQHMSRIVDLIDGETPGFAQMILTTHHRSLRDRFKKTGRSHTVELDSRWSLHRGIRVQKSTSLLGELRGALDADDFDRQIVASKAGVVLEQLLDELALVYRLKLPRMEEAQYTLYELLNATGKPMNAVLVTHASDATPVSPLSAFKVIEKMEFIRNQVGAHFNLIGLDVSDRDVEAFGRRTIELADVLCCGACGQVPSVQGQTFYRCRCKDSRSTMTPLRFS
jgi:hypothetical protein